jgi:hypothetical protein
MKAKTAEDYLKEVREASDADWIKQGYTLAKPEFSLQYGSKYIRVVVTVFGSNAVHCFLDADGNIYKSASWSKPAKGIRGNINNDKKPLRGWEYYNRY